MAPEARYNHLAGYTQKVVNRKERSDSTYLFTMAVQRWLSFKLLN